ncbi:hypothetical protein LTR35_007046 [Friedmanniomyces endolithicus]|uniref:ABC transporter domain-containing protein n=1 Tax=Friedmanniomyces endolithicus TaxID=329885 RepID=A0AAN6FF46_9PEZI|nr:hypothetical protein LTS00_015512 [Friedmanniomyces endolithicus]KAK0281949.1 hypothetical protein LTR35_007046 [Friedmanniomyces endolithicus]KAK0316006.1 hypothetical protein LTR82_012299 [Friedmanniomyces endolithicus]KAK1017315.1 hypothetical protein LTR54_002692 [Friedmanniomyces endolithicus]
MPIWPPSFILNYSTPAPVIKIENAAFYRRYPGVNDSPGANPPLLEGVNFTLPGNDGRDPRQSWSVISPSSVARTTFLQILAGQHICIPPQARSYPYLSTISQSPQHAIKYVGFDAERGSNVGGTSVRGAYLSARYESRREETDFCVQDYLTGHTELNALERDDLAVDSRTFDEVTRQLNLRSLLQMPVANLSNGQTRRARIAKALIAKPEILLLDGPFMGLDPNTLRTMAEVLRQIAERQQPRLIMSLGLRTGCLRQGMKQGLFNGDVEASKKAEAHRILNAAEHAQSAAAQIQVSRDDFKRTSPPLPPGEALVEMCGIRVAYGDKVVLGDWKQSVTGGEKPGLWWSLHRGQRCAILGPNGSGKTTMLSLITSDHPQTYSLPIKLFGRSRLPGPGQPGISLFDIQRRMGHSSPEVHAFFPKGLTIRRVLESAWADAPLSKPKLNEEAKQRVNACLRWFARELNPADSEPTMAERLEAAKSNEGARELRAQIISSNADLDWASKLTFREAKFSNQRLLLFLRALVSQPDLVILDEALSGIDEAIRDKALLFLSHGEKVSKVVDDVAQPSMLARIGATVVDGLSPRQALLVISHSKEDVPGCIREWICLPEPGEGREPRTGVLSGPLELNAGAWGEIWGR